MLPQPTTTPARERDTEGVTSMPDKPTMRRCTKCGETKPEAPDYFPRDRRARGGLHSRCKPCRYAATAVWLQANREQVREKQRSYAAENRERRAENNAKWRNANREYVAAQQAAYYAANREHALAYAAQRGRVWYYANLDKARLLRRVYEAVRTAVKRGILIRPTTCEVCGREGKIQGAHADYSKPLDVRWLCRSCHATWDAEQPKIH